MKTVTITGASDDLVEIEGDWQEEYGHYSSGNDDKPAWLHFNDGTVVRVLYDQRGLWTAAVEKLGEGATQIKFVAANEEEDTNDRLTLRGNLLRADLWSSADGPTKNDLIEKCEQIVDQWRPSSCTKEQLQKAYAALVECV